jgi:Ku70/Ku80 beta-barrel domain
MPVDDEELDGLALESTHTIDIEKFVPRSEIDERYLDSPYYLTPEDRVGQVGRGYIGLNGSRIGGHQPSFGIAEGLLLGREEIRNSPCNNIQDSFAVRKQQRGLAYFNLIRANLYPNGNSHLLFF